jgi:hypothetical protein
MTISPKDEPGICSRRPGTPKGDIDRVSYIAEVVNGKQTITGELPENWRSRSGLSSSCAGRDPESTDFLERRQRRDGRVKPGH